MRTIALPRTDAIRAPRPRFRFHPSARLRILGWYVGLLAVALAAALVLQSTLLRAQLDAEVDRDLALAVDVVRRAAQEADPATGQLVHGSVEDVFDAVLSRAVLAEGEAYFTLVAGRPYKSTITPLQLLDLPDLVGRWAGATATIGGTTDTSEGQVRWVAAPLLAGGTVAGTFVAANFLSGERSEIDDVLRIGAVVFVTVAALATAAVWLLAGRILRPIRLVTEAAREIGEADWSRRIEVDGEDEIAELARTFNAMLDRLESAYSTQRRFIDDAGHELWTPITIIRGHLEVMGDDPAERAATREIVLDELDRMSRMVDDLLVLARAGQPDFVVVEPVDLAGLTEELVRKADALTGRTWATDGTASGTLPADRQRLVQAVMNLVRNAAAYTPEGTPVAIGTALDRQTVRIWVRDEGPGIAEADRERIFERFARGSAGARRTDGTGLGLSIVAAIAAAHGGRLQLDTALGKGSTFTIELPIHPEARST